MVEWQEIRKKVWAILNEASKTANPQVKSKEIIEWVKTNYGKQLPPSYLEEEYHIMSMLVGKVFAGADDKQLMIDYAKSGNGEGVMFLGPPKVVIGKVTLSKITGTPQKANAATGVATPTCAKSTVPVVPRKIHVDTQPTPSKKPPVVATAPAVQPEQPKPKPVEIEEPHLGCEITDFTKGLIPQNDGYIPRKLGKWTDIDVLKTAFMKQKNVMLSGPPGGGKSASVRHFCYQYHIPYVRVECHGGIEIADLIGQWIPDPECAGKFKWNDGLLTHIVRHGGVFVADEINGMPREFALKFHGLLDDERRLILTEKDGEIITAHKRFCFVGCQNPNAEGTRRLNNAFFDRFHIAMEYDYDTAIEKKIIGDSYIRDFADRARKMHGKELETYVSTRLMMHYESNCEDFDEDMASQLFLNKFDPEERQKVKEVYDLVVRGRKKQTRAKQQTEDEAAAGLGALFD